MSKETFTATNRVREGKWGDRDKIKMETGSRKGRDRRQVKHGEPREWRGVNQAAAADPERNTERPSGSRTHQDRGVIHLGVRAVACCQETELPCAPFTYAIAAEAVIKPGHVTDDLDRGEAAGSATRSIPQSAGGTSLCAPTPGRTGSGDM